jgi:hypothetical protein
MRKTKFRSPIKQQTIAFKVTPCKKFDLVKALGDKFSARIQAGSETSAVSFPTSGGHFVGHGAERLPPFLRRV